jgi:cyclopropane fatty-acyl-phospholipid synthase-like methyltransferase
MKGIINKGIQEFIEAKYGQNKWEGIKLHSDCQEPFFAISLDYPDEMSLSLFKSTSSILELEPAQVMIEYGKFMLPIP